MNMFLGSLALGIACTGAAPARAAFVGDADAAAGQGPAQFPHLFLKAERVIVRPGEVLENAQVVVRDGKIVAVGRELTKPEGSRELEAKVLCAGFVDPWGAVGMAADALFDGGATAATRSVDGFDPFNADHLRREALRAGVTSARIQAGATARIGGRGVLVRLQPGASRDEAVIVDDCNLWATIGVGGNTQQATEQMGEDGPMVTFGTRAPDPFDRLESLDRLVSALQAGRNYLVAKNEYRHDLEEWVKKTAEKEAELEKEFKKAKKDREKAQKDAEEKGKKFEEKKYKEDKKPSAPRFDEDNEVLARAANGDLPLIVHVQRAGELNGLLAATRGMNRLRLIVAGGTQAATCAKELAERRIPVIVMPSPTPPDGVDDPENLGIALAGKLQREGVQVLLGSGGADAGASRDLPLLAAMAVGYGLDRERAFHALTLGAARELDAEGRVGTVEVGKDADLVLWDGEPLDTTATPRFVVVGGQVVVTPEDR